MGVLVCICVLIDLLDINEHSPTYSALNLNLSLHGNKINKYIYIFFTMYTVIHWDGSLINCWSCKSVKTFLAQGCNNRRKTRIARGREFLIDNHDEYLDGNVNQVSF